MVSEEKRERIKDMISGLSHILNTIEDVESWDIDWYSSELRFIQKLEGMIENRISRLEEMIEGE